MANNEKNLEVENNIEIELEIDDDIETKLEVESQDINLYGDNGEANSTSSDIAKGKSGYVNGVLVEGTNEIANYDDQLQVTNGVLSFKVGNTLVVLNLAPNNIKKGVTILGVEGTLELKPLATPSIYVEEEIDTNAILGRAILGYMVLGRESEKVLATPSIYLEQHKLDTPQIYLETNRLATPNIYVEKEYLGTLETPNIYLESYKLETPNIYLEST